MWLSYQADYLKSRNVIICIILLYAISYEGKRAEEDCVDVPSCTSRECVHHAKMLHDNMKLDTDPCTDFYSFSCRGYADRFGKKDTKTIYDDMWLSFQLSIKDVLDNLKTDDGSASKKMKKMYDICMNIENAELKSVSDALEFLRNIGIPDWPILSEEFEYTSPSLIDVLGKLAAHGEFAFIKFQLSPYKENDDQTHSSSIPLLLPDNYLFDSKLKAKDIENSIYKILTYFRIDKSATSNILESFKTIENIGIKLQNEKTEKALKCKDSKAVYTKLNCSQEVQDNLKFLCSFWKSAVNTGNLRQTFLTDVLHISCRWSHYYYVENLFPSLGNFTHKSIAHYLALRFFFSHLDDMNLYFRLIKKTYSGVKDSRHKSTHLIERWQYCIGWIIKSMHLTLGYEYTSNVMTEPEQNDILNMIQDYIHELRNLTANQNWINENVKFYLTRQLGKLETGFKTSMEKYRNKTLADTHYKEFKPTEGSFLKNILEYKRSLNPAIVNAETSFTSFYSTSDSYTLDFGLSLFFPPAYSLGLPKLWNYAAIGWIISHELIHNLKLLFEVVPLDDETESEFLNKTECYVSQYLQFLREKTGKQVLSSETKEEIIADNIGWELAEIVIRKKFNMTNASYLPSLKYNPQQVLYLSFVQVSCETMSKEIENELYHTKPHNVQNLRVTGVIQNSKMFSQIFGCPIRSPMNPEKKCVFFE